MNDDDDGSTAEEGFTHVKPLAQPLHSIGFARSKQGVRPKTKVEIG